MTEVREITFRSPIFDKIRQEVVLDAVREIRILLVVAQVFERQDGDRFIDLVGRGARQEEETRDAAESASANDAEQNEIAPPAPVRGHMGGTASRSR